MMQLVPIEEVYVEAFQVKHPIIDCKVHIEGQRSYWKIIRLGGSSASYQFFVDIEDFPLSEQLSTANEDKFQLLIQSDATADELCAAVEVKE
nr:hypothetical protein [Tanacetum cinerariifolium]